MATPRGVQGLSACYPSRSCGKRDWPLAPAPTHRHSQPHPHSNPCDQNRRGRLALEVTAPHMGTSSSPGSSIQSSSSLRYLGGQQRASPWVPVCACCPLYNGTAETLGLHCVPHVSQLCGMSCPGQRDCGNWRAWMICGVGWNQERGEPLLPAGPLAFPETI